jgi:nucleoside 2-deoxyribosyltransferase
MPNKKVIYFAGSIRGGRDDQQLYVKILEQLKQYGTVLTEHIGNEQLSSEGERISNQQIHDRDLEWLISSDCVIAEVTTPSLGVGYEIGKASEWGKPILCLFRPAKGRSLSAMIAGCANVTLREYDSPAELNDVFYEFLNGL